MEERKLVAETEIEVNGYDIDAMGIVSNIVYVRWFEDLRTIFVNKHLNASQMLKQNISPILMHTEIDYKVPITIHDRPVGRCWLTKISRLKWTFEFEIASGDTVHATGMQYGGFFNIAEQKITRVPEVFRNI
ncbi:thioesterase superfamily protein [Staphylococcus carnosus]|uniref:Acyl-CoA thioester hydrolase n=2 Tax=Staphylococcus carnosus TaxID=1281 RepID=A0AAJ0NHQ9_STACA|nr:acyl-CoA thioester hydrolase [Staphylococcus carnosus]KKB25889.1 acyl-CoA thioester hydrolase [Staphylococcus carnosus]KOR13015.1 acyl-CoA thioester hydrolase [Staphylococcus carnosus]UTB77483.1 acyl-CoA thioester hydrolase [Staphylococcus carnosus]UTB79887.1 acyl-CoA thioester hydrolase [Staphylococcus carnosus]